MIDSGSLNERIEITDHNYNHIMSVWANVRPISTREMLRSGAVITSDIFTVLIRYVSGLNVTMKVIFKGVKYDIIAINDDFKDNSIILTLSMNSEQKIRSTS